MAKKNFWNKLKYLFVEEVKQKKYNLKDLDEIDRKKEDKEKNTEEKNKETKIDEAIEIINTSQENENIENNIQLNNDENQSIDESNENEDSISKETEGVPDEILYEASKSGVSKINVDTDLRLAMTAGIRKVFHDEPNAFDPRKYLTPARELIKETVKHKMENVFGSNNKA